MSSRPKRKAAPTVFVDDGTIPEDTSIDEKSISNEDDLLKDSGEDYSDSAPSEEEPPKKIAATTKAESTGKKTIKPLPKESAVKKARTFKLLVNTITPQGSSPKINVKKISILEYETATPIQAAKKMGPTIHAAKIGKAQNTVYVFDIQEVTTPTDQKTFSYICESVVAPDESTKHTIKPKTKKNTPTKDTSVPVVKKAVANQHPIVPKKSVPTRANAKQLIDREQKPFQVRKKQP